MAMKFEIEGAKALQAALEKLPERVAKNVLRGAVFAGSKVIRDEAKALAPRDTGKLADSIIAKRDRGTRLEVVAGVAIDKEGRKPKRIWHLPEFGTVKAPATPYLRPALEGKGQAALDEMKKYIEKRIEKEAKKLAKRK